MAAPSTGCSPDLRSRERRPSAPARRCARRVARMTSARVQSLPGRSVVGPCAICALSCPGVLCDVLLAAAVLAIEVARRAIAPKSPL